MDSILRSRRDFIGLCVTTALSYAVIDFLNTAKVLASPVLSETSRWLKGANDLAVTVKRREITAITWQTEMERLLATIDLPEFLKYIDFTGLQRQQILPTMGESFKFFALPEDSSLPEELTFYRNLAGFRKDRAIPPHGHDNLVSSFMVLNGSLHGRHFDRIRDDGNVVLVKPTIDKVITKGEYSTVSETKDNVHWFKALSEGSFIFDLGVGNLDPHWVAKGLNLEQTQRWKTDSNGDPGKSGRVYLDIEQKEKAGQGLFRVSRITHSQAYAKYG